MAVASAPADPGAGAPDGPGPDPLDATALRREDLPEALAEVHGRGALGGAVTLLLPPDRAWSDEWIADVVVGAGFTPGPGPGVEARSTAPRALALTRQLTLADRVAPGMGMLVCGLNPSVYSAEAGIGFARPGNRFWPAALAAGLVERDRDPTDALRTHGIGMTDLVKRATPRADALRTEEYRAGLARVTRLVAWLRPEVVCFVGLTGWRAAADRRAVAGWQPDGLGQTAVYVMPSTSGLNAHASLADLTDHLRAAVSPRGGDA